MLTTEGSFSRVLLLLQRKTKQAQQATRQAQQENLVFEN
jgi:hypothetical protein